VRQDRDTATSGGSNDQRGVKKQVIGAETQDFFDGLSACDPLKAFAAERGLKIAAKYVENESGAKLARPKLIRLLADAEPSEVLLVEQVEVFSIYHALGLSAHSGTFFFQTSPLKMIRRFSRGIYAEGSYEP
jgi:hypothetical protein